MVIKPVIVFGAMALLAPPVWAAPALHVNNPAQCPLTLDKGQTLHVTLPTNHSIGYQWRLTQAAPEQLNTIAQAASVEQPVQAVAAPGEIAPPKRAPQLGGETPLRWSFTAHTAGAGELRLVKLLPRLHGDKPQQTFACAIKVKR